MSVHVSSWVLRKSPVTNHRNLLVLMALADYADPDGRNAFPKRNTIASVARCSRTSVGRALTELERDGDIRRGDQSYVQHLKAQYRPTVWDIVLDDSRARPDEEPGGSTVNLLESPEGSALNPLEGSTVDHIDPSIDPSLKDANPAAQGASRRTEEKPVKIEQEVTRWAYDQVGQAFNFIAVRGIVKWAIHDRGNEPKDVAKAVVEIHRSGKPITKQIMDQRLPKTTHRAENQVDKLIEAGEVVELGKLTGVIYPTPYIDEELSPAERKKVSREKWTAWALENREKLIQRAQGPSRVS